VPTILEAAGIKAPTLVDGIEQNPIEGVGMSYTFDKANAAAPSTRTTQYFEMAGNRGIYHQDWYANTTPPVAPWILNAPMPDIKDYKWELYHVSDDYSQADDLAEKMPEKLKELQELFDNEAKKFNVYPLDNSAFQRAITPRPSAVAGKTEFTYSGVMPGIPSGSAPSILNRSFTITAEVDVPEACDGMIVTDGGWSGGYGLYLLKGRPVFSYNLLQLLIPRWAGEKPLARGKHTIVFDFKYDGPGIAKGGSGELKVDGQTVSTFPIGHTIPFLMPADETFDVGVDTRTGVNDQDYRAPFPFKGTILKLTFKLGPTQLTQLEHRKMQEAYARSRD
jgi:arylsulfatase